MKRDEGGPDGPRSLTESMFERVTRTMQEIAAKQEAELRKIALRLLGEEVGDPEELMRRLKEHIRKYAGPDAELVLCEVQPQYLAPGVLHEWYLAIDPHPGEEGTVPVRIGPSYQITDGGIAPTGNAPQAPSSQ